jgi:hypothetical protein
MLTFVFLELTSTPTNRITSATITVMDTFKTISKFDLVLFIYLST